MVKNLIEPRDSSCSLNRAIASWLHAEWRYFVALKRLQFGHEGESATKAFLKENGYRILEKNFRSKLGEIDVIAEQAG